MTPFVANRTDGLGARLLNLLITMVLAERHGGLFQFTWRRVKRDFHALDFAEDVFHADFLKAHFVPESAAQHRGVLRLDPEDDLRSGAVAALLAQKPNAIVVSRYDPPALLMATFGSRDDNPFARAFDRIGFAAGPDNARRLARSVAVQRAAVAIHLRAGDIVFGDYRFRSGFETKVICLPLAAHLIRSSLSGGMTPILFGQDERATRWLSDTFGVPCVEDLADLTRLTVLERAVFEMTLLSRMEAIHGGLSSFVQVPAVVGGVPLHDPAEVMEWPRLAQTILAGIDGIAISPAIDRLHVAFAFWSAAHFGAGDQPLDARIAALNGAIAHDPSNAFYRLELAATFADARRWCDVDAALEAAFDLKGGDSQFAKRPLVRVVTGRRRGGGLEAAPVIDRLRPAAEDGGVMAHIVLAIAAQRCGDFVDAKRHLAAARRGGGAKAMTVLAERHLRREILTVKGVGRAVLSLIRAWRRRSVGKTGW